MAAESYPQDLKYHKEHDWVRVEGDEVVLGITWYAQDALGDIVYASLPDAGKAVSAGDAYGELESVKAVAEAYTPLGGEVTARNEALDADPSLVNTDPYVGGWLVRLRPSDAAELDGLMGAKAYEAFLAQAGD